VLQIEGREGSSGAVDRIPAGSSTSYKLIYLFLTVIPSVPVSHQTIVAYLLPLFSCTPGKG